MSVIDRAKLFGKFVQMFELWGYEVSEVTDLSTVKDLIFAAEKPYLSSFGSVEFNDFTESNVLWLSVTKLGKPAYLGCARLEELGSERVDRYWRRLFVRHHGEDVTFEGALPEVVSELRGRIVYFGDLFVSKDHRGSRVRLRAFLAMAHLAVSLKWDPDYTYCFIRESHILRGSSSLYGFTRQYCTPINWKKPPPKPRTADDWLVVLPKSELLNSVRNTLRKTTAFNTSND